ncbi:rSAM-associated Gly-rich repeat protein [Cyanobium sp. ATX 6A2]|uniref:GrrA/OscA1 family cyclophane-containing rSAM-modified RiPP n=1 Tax=Cyanobium sp. ATX 6A2 TaxID=2823700 RepID=UPI0020CBF697|nr:GrrA/OscA1 family cyclophane-containing rSAM-modified RiPP [Cyanobium sp. ATX 6A2]MCP9889375.1 rSAM-associated Gly-rich repeat protein [Cyanobium sp. ATX 6A2]
MTITSRAGLLGFLFSMVALTQPATAASSAPVAPAETADSQISSIEGRLSRIAEAVRQRQAQLEADDGGLAVGDGLRVAAFVNGPRGGAVRGPVGGAAFANGHPYYGGASRGFVNGGGGFVNARPGGAAFRNW